jgi:hypothetical protein
MYKGSSTTRIVYNAISVGVIVGSLCSLAIDSSHRLDWLCFALFGGGSLVGGLLFVW